VLIRRQFIGKDYNWYQTKYTWARESSKRRVQSSEANTVGNHNWSPDLQHRHSEWPRRSHRQHRRWQTSHDLSSYRSRARCPTEGRRGHWPGSPWRCPHRTLSSKRPCYSSTTSSVWCWHCLGSWTADSSYLYTIYTPKILIVLIALNGFKRLLPRQFFTGCHPLVGLSFAEVLAGYLLWCWCTAELRVLNDEYTRQWHLPMHINCQWQQACGTILENNSFQPLLVWPVHWMFSNEMRYIIYVLLTYLPQDWLISLLAYRDTSNACLQSNVWKMWRREQGAQKTQQ